MPILQWFVAVKANRGVYADAIISGVALSRADELSSIPDNRTNHGYGRRLSSVQINKGMM